MRTALRRLPPVASNPSGPLGPGLLASGLLGTIIHNLQDGLAEPEMLSWLAPTLTSDPGIDHRAARNVWHVQPIAHDGGSGRRSQAETSDAAGTACPVEADPEPRDPEE